MTPYEEFLKKRQEFGQRLGESHKELSKYKYDNKAKKQEKNRHKFESKTMVSALKNKMK